MQSRCDLGAITRSVCAQVEKLREEEGKALEEKMARTRAREAAMAEESSDSEIVFSDETDEDE